MYFWGVFWGSEGFVFCRGGAGDRNLSGIESVILSRESGDSESCDSNCVIPRSRFKH